MDATGGLGWQRWITVASGLACAGVLGTLVACFDSDDRYRFSLAGTDDGYTTDDGDTDEGTTGPIPPDLPPPDTTCKEVINCLVGCATDPDLWNNPEPDLSCFIECEDGLTVDEALKFLDLSECAAASCVDKGDCVEEEDFIGPNGESGLPIDPSSVCAGCIIGLLLDPEPPGCEGFAMECK